MTSEQRGKWYAENLRKKYNKILAQNGTLRDEDYEHMIADVEACTNQDVNCRSAVLDVVEEFQRKYEEAKSDSRTKTVNPDAF